MPHAFAVDQIRARRGANIEHAAVDVCRHAAQHVLRRLAHARRPIATNQLAVAANAAGVHDNDLRAFLEIADGFARGRLATFGRIGGQQNAARADDRAVFHDPFIHSVTERKAQHTPRFRIARAAHKRFDHARPGAPVHVKTRHRIAVADRSVTTTLGPADQRKPAHAHRMQPRAFSADAKCT